jgi:hypothetical protein
MKPFFVEQTEKSPRIELNPEENKLTIEGVSRPENVREFYVPLNDNLQNYLSKLFKKKQEDEEFSISTFELHFKMGYFNSASAKFIADILNTVTEFNNKGIDAKVYWYYEENDEDMREAGEDFSEMVAYPFNFVMVEKSDEDF